MAKGIVIVRVGDMKEEYELEIPLNVSVKEISIAIFKALNIDDNKSVTGYYLKTENPTCFLKGNDILSSYGISSGSKIILV